jgi:hypothetical protein
MWLNGAVADAPLPGGLGRARAGSPLTVRLQVMRTLSDRASSPWIEADWGRWRFSSLPSYLLRAPGPWGQSEWRPRTSPAAVALLPNRTAATADGGAADAEQRHHVRAGDNGESCGNDRDPGRHQEERP